MPKEEIKIITFAGVCCLVCSLALSATHISLKPRQLENKENDRKLNVLAAFGVETVVDGAKISPETIKGYFTDNIRDAFIDANGDLVEGMTFDNYKLAVKEDSESAPLPLYIWSEGGKDIMYGFPMKGRGLWSTIYSYVAVEEDLETIKGITFYGHAETPGLGAECSKPWFMDQFKGKKIYEAGKPATFEVVKGKAGDKYSSDHDMFNNAVDGMSGATITGKGIEAFINDYNEAYDKFFQKIRG